MKTTTNPVALAVWSDRVNPFDRVGSGTDYTEQNATSSSIKLNFRAVDADDFRSMAYTGGMDEPVSDVCLYIWFDHNSAFNMEFNANGVSFATQRKVELLAKMMKKWNVRAERAYDKRRELTDTRESFNDCLVRMIKATGAETTLCIGDWRGGPERKYENISIKEAITKYVMPAIAHVRARMKTPDKAT